MCESRPPQPGKSRLKGLQVTAPVLCAHLSELETEPLFLGNGVFPRNCVRERSLTVQAQKHIQHLTREDSVSTNR